MKPGIIVLQSSHHGFMLCREELEKMGFEMETDFCVLSYESGIHELWVPGKRQLLITGTLSGGKEGVAEMVQRARDLNPELVCMSFARDPIPGPFDHVINKGRESRECLVAAIQGFLAGTLNRTKVHWTPPVPKKEHWPWAL